MKTVASERKVSIAYFMMVCVFVIQFCDVFFIHADNKVFADTILARILGIVLAVIAAKMVHFNLKKHCFKAYGLLFEILYGIGFAVIPIAFFYIIEVIYFRIRDYRDVLISFSVPNTTAFLKFDLTVAPVILYILTVLISALFKEMFFRGYLMTQFIGKYGLKKANIIQSALYASLSIPNMLYSLINGSFKDFSVILTVYMLVIYPIINFLCGVKWGCFYRVNGTIWMSVADHFMNNFLLTCVYISPDRLPEKWFALEVLAVQVLSCAMFIPMYLYRDKANMMAAEEAKIGMEVLKPDLDTENLLSDDDGVIPLRNIKGREALSPAPVTVHKKKPDDSITDLKNDLQDREIHEEAEKAETAETIQSNEKANDISKLVKNYFDSEFDKHTFGKYSESRKSRKQ